MNTTAPVQKTKVTKDGIVLNMSDSVIGYKCLACSTVHLLDDEAKYNVGLAAEAIGMWQQTHATCGALFL